MSISTKAFRHRRLLLALAVAASSASGSFANVINMTSSKDNTLYEDSTGNLSNGAGDAMFVGKTFGNTPPLRRGLIQFDLTVVPTNALVNAATLTLTAVKSHGLSNIVTLHDASQAWGEGTSDAGGTGGAGTVATTNDATWLNTFYQSLMWTNPGGDFAGTVVSSANVASGAATFPSNPTMVADLTGWIASPESNFGWVLVGDESALGTATRVATRENADPSARPVLSVDYSTSTWKTSGGVWSSTANWNFGVPNGAGAEANFTAAPAGAVAVNVDGGGKTAGILNFGGSGAYTLAGSAITLSRATANSAINVTAGSHVISAPLNLGNSTDVSIAAGSTLTVSGAIAAVGGVSVNKSGGGTFAINNLRADGLNITDGTVAVAPNGAAAGTGRVSSLAIATGRLDLSNNKLIVNGGDVAALTALIASGRNGGNWSGSGIVTSQASAQSGFTSLGIATAQQAKGLASPSATAVFSGQTVTGSDVLVMYTYGGDANLDGKINVDDYGHIDSSVVLPGVTGWINGDFNYDGKINVDDYGIIDSNVPIQGSAFPTASGTSAPLSAVPEPTTPAIVALLALASRRRHRNVPRGTFP